MLAAVWPGHATAQEVSNLDRFELFNECAPIRFFTENDTEAPAIGLIDARIRTLVESRLRSARLYDADAESWLFIRVNVAGKGSFSLSVEYKKLVYDAVSGETNYATTWDHGGAGTHGAGDGASGFILQNLSETLDGFILKYLRVNEAAC